MIIGITGSFGAGKGVLANYLVQEKGFAHFSARNFLIEEINRRDLPVNRDSMIEVANDLRAHGGPTFIFEKLVAQAKKHEGNSVVESVRAVAEAKYIKEKGGVLLGVDSDPKIRYERAMQRGSVTDQVSFEKWQDQEVRESNPDDPTKQDIFGALRESDYIIQNEEGIKELQQKLEVILKQIENAT